MSDNKTAYSGQDYPVHSSGPWSVSAGIAPDPKGRLIVEDWQQEWQPTERDNRLHELATRYHTECEAYDQTVCTGPMGQDGILPANPHEMALINRNAHAVRKSLEEEAQCESIGREELSRAISKWHGSLPNRHG